MLNIKTKIAAASASAIILSSLFSSGAFAANTIDISGNGNGSTNGAAVIKVSKSKVKQKNRTIVGTNVTSIANTGGNKTNNNTGGDVDSKTGDVKNDVGVTVVGGTNTNSGENCCCDGQGDGTNDVTISGNGNNSTNGVLILDICKHKVFQKNTTIVGTNVTTVSNTGDNQTNGNTGGTTGSDTGNAETTVMVDVTGSSNTN